VRPAYPLTPAELEAMRRSIAACGSLPRDQLDRLLAEALLLAREREELEALWAEVAPPWGEVRVAMNRIDRILRSRHR